MWVTEALQKCPFCGEEFDVGGAVLWPEYAAHLASHAGESTDEKPISELMDELVDKWENIYIVYEPEKKRSFGSVTIRDHTDEGLGGQGYGIRGDDLREALEKAVKNPETKLRGESDD